MGKLIAMGEVLVDFLGSENNYSYNPGGAPANVASTVAHFGGEATVISRVGNDLFGLMLINDLKEALIDTSNIVVDDKRNTSLAFVSNNTEGDRTFSFIRKQSADLFMDKESIKDIFKSHDIFHFCSVDLVTKTNREAHKKALEKALANNCIISFDPNIRLNLWDDADLLKDIVNEFIPFAHILKLSEEELAFINGDNNLYDLFRGNVKLVILTKGSEGALIATKHNEYEVKAQNVKAVDTTGAGDSFIGAFLYQLLKDNVSVKNLLNVQNRFAEYLDFASKVSGYVCTKKGSLKIMPTKDDLREFYK